VETLEECRVGVGVDGEEFTDGKGITMGINEAVRAGTTSC